MIVDLNLVNEADIEVDVCIIGSGPAGLAAALSLEEQGDVSIAVCEAGQLDYS